MKCTKLQKVHGQWNKFISVSENVSSRHLFHIIHFLKRVVYFSNQSYRDTKRGHTQRFYIFWLTPWMAAAAIMASGRSWKPGASCRSSMWGQGPKLGPSSATFQGTLAGSWNGSAATGTQLKFLWGAVFGVVVNWPPSCAFSTSFLKIPYRFWVLKNKKTVMFSILRIKGLQKRQEVMILTKVD